VNDAMSRRVTHLVWFLRSVAGLWLFAAFSKMMWLVEAAPLASRTPGPLSGISGGQVLAVVALVEAVLASYLLFEANPKPRLVVCTGACLAGLVYRVGLAWLAPGTSCHCFGAHLFWLGIGSVGTERLASGVLAYCCIGSVICWLVATSPGWTDPGPLAGSAIPGREPSGKSGRPR
jgi:hypothetical protein